ncbi:MAG: glycoside hydrolase family 88 protein [Dysgonamonadaceae bacterium]|jgi:rhamnogalacturonyl hydrolase YesR|nr:glycoside hydrolase family 88 protein [Dysgonamonadaceae bacterium]
MKKILIYHLTFLFLSLQLIQAQAGKILNADGISDTYRLIESYGYGIEVPDCGHPVKHITQVFDKELNKYVFAFTLHAALDDDRCGVKDRQRAEIKTFGPSPESMKGFEGKKQVYKWRLKLDEDFQPSPDFCHIHQVKADAGPKADAPIVTLTPRWKESGEVLQFNHVSQENQSTILAEVPLKAFKGVWVEVTETIVHSHSGSLEMEIRRLSDGKILLHGKGENLDMWRNGSNFNRPKYGIYRSLRSPTYLRDETVLFSDIEFQEAGHFADNHNAKIFNLRDFGPSSDGKTIDSPVIQRAIDACHAKGGGTVVIPPGTYLCATIVMKDNVRLYLDKNALLLGTTDINAYDNLDPFTEGLGVAVGWAFITAIDVENIAIEGEGIIDGQGSALKAGHIINDTRPESERWGRRPFLLRVLRCNNVTVQGITLKYAAAWTSHYAQSSNIRIDDVKIISKGVAHNDGINIDGCQQVEIRNCNIDSGDDALCFKATYSKSPCKDITVTGMRLKSSQAGIKIGTESMSSFENIRISQCHIYDTRNGGIKLLTVDGAHLKNIEITDITMDNVRTPMLFRLGSRLNVFRKGDEKQTTGSFEHVFIRNIKARSDSVTQLTPASGILITGVPGHPINNLTLENIEIELPGGGTLEEGHRIVQEAVEQYPEVKTFGPYVPAYGVWARHVKNLQLNNITFRLNKADLRPALICQDAMGLIVNNLEADAFVGSEAVIRLDSVRCAYITTPSIAGQSNAFLQLTGTENNEIYLDGKQSVHVNTMIDAINGSQASTVEQRPFPDAANTTMPGARLSYQPGKTPKSWAVATAQSVMSRWPDYSKAYWNSWTYVNAYMALAFERLYKETGEKTYLDYIKKYIDGFVDENGNLQAVRNHKGVTRMPVYCSNLDGMMPGNTLVMIYEYYKDERYKKAAEKIRHCLDSYPRNSDGGFWHGNGMHGQMWIDGIFMGQLFLLRYGKTIGDSEYAFNEAINQITAYAKRGERDKTGLYVHGIYEAGHGDRICRWADAKGGQSPEVWSEGLGWYALVLVEALETIPENYPRYNEIKDIYIRLAKGLKKTQDPKTGGWYQVVDKTTHPDNWIDTSGSSMFVYAIQQGINLGILSKKGYKKVVENGYKSITSHAKVNKSGLVDIDAACDGLGVQDSYDKYIHYKQMLNAKEAYAGFVWATEIVEREKNKKK